MLDETDRKVLQLARDAAKDAEPSWRDAKWAAIFLIGGIVMIVWDISLGDRPGPAGPFMLGFGLAALLIQGPISRLVWHSYRVIRKADAKGAFEDETPAI